MISVRGIPRTSVTRSAIASVVLALVALASPSIASAAGVPMELVASGYSQPVFVTNAGDERLFVVEQTGKIKIVGGGVFLDLTNKIRVMSEQGLLGLAFHPDYAINGLFYVKYSRKSDGDDVIAEYKRSLLDPDVADPSSARIVLQYNQPTEGHNGGWLGFLGENLYISQGDASLHVSPAQNLKKRLGKILRINPLDPDGPGPLTYSIPADNPYATSDTYKHEIFASGLRNPWRCSFDRLTLYLWCGDVGQSDNEEINRSETGNGDNYGWPLLEGFDYYQYPGKTAGNPCTANCKDLPILQYHHGRNCAVTGGYVSRRDGAAMYGKYVFGDFCSGKIWLIPADFVAGSPLPMAVVDTASKISSFGEGADGKIYMVDLKGRLYRLTDS